jgi:hypothetical protein
MPRPSLNLLKEKKKKLAVCERKEIRRDTHNFHPCVLLGNPFGCETRNLTRKNVKLREHYCLISETTVGMCSEVGTSAFSAQLFA